MHVEKGKIREISLESVGKGKEKLEQLCSRLKGNRHDPGTVEQACLELEIVHKDLAGEFIMNLF
jgi:hypothetical protein